LEMLTPNLKWDITRIDLLDESFNTVHKVYDLYKGFKKMSKSIVISERDNIAAVLENGKAVEFFIHRGIYYKRCVFC
jgi:hypothetical protein